VDAAANIAKQFVREGVLMHTRDVSGKDDPILINGGTEAAFEVVVLTNELTASASEILTGALQDYKVAKVIGTKTYGKGVVQSVWPLSAGGYLKITYEEYFTPNQHQVHKLGIKPDLNVEGYTPQLITGLYEAGITELALTIKKDTVKINGLELLGSVDVIREGSKVYLPAKLLAAAVNGKVHYNPSNKLLTVAKGLQKGNYKLQAQGVKVKAGISYIELGLFKKAFNQLSWSQTESGVQVQIKEVK
jgi:carboxyl-terminal processing protease